MATSDLDSRVRAAAFEFLAEQTRLRGEVLAWETLSRGFDFNGTRVPLVGPQGIFKPSVLTDVPLTIRTAPIVEGRERPYEDRVEEGGAILYRYRGTDPRHPDNVGPRPAGQHAPPLGARIHRRSRAAGAGVQGGRRRRAAPAPGLAHRGGRGDRGAPEVHHPLDPSAAPSAELPPARARGLPAVLRHLPPAPRGAARGRPHPARWPPARRARGAERPGPLHAAPRCVRRPPARHSPRSPRRGEARHSPRARRAHAPPWPAGLPRRAHPHPAQRGPSAEPRLPGRAIRVVHESRVARTLPSVRSLRREPVGFHEILPIGPGHTAQRSVAREGESSQAYGSLDIVAGGCDTNTPKQR